MAWLALADHDGQEFTPTGLGTTGEDATGLETDELLSKGTLLIETRRARTLCVSHTHGMHPGAGHGWP